MNIGNSRIVSLQVENVKRLRAVDITPTGDVVVVAGRNGQGKSSVLDSIMYALAGGKSLPEDPIRHGEHKAEITVDLGEVVVTRTIAPTGSRLVVKNRDGASFGSPQAMLDAIVGKLSFDPLAFARQDAKAQGESLRALLGLDTSALDSERARVFADRTATARSAKAAAAAVAAMPNPEVVAPRRSVSAIMDELEKVRAHNRAQDRITQARDEADAEVRRLDKTREALLCERDRIDQMLAANAKALESATEAARTKPMPGAYLPEDELLRSIRTVEATNRICDEAEARAKAAEQAAAIEQTVERMTERLAQIDAEKRSMLASAPLPIEGLELKDDGTVSYQGVPLAQASSAEQIKVGMAVGLFSNPNLKVVLIRDGSLLDDDSLRSVADIAASAGAQVWIERVGKSAVEGALTVVIEDGAVVEEVAS